MLNPHLATIHGEKCGQVAHAMGPLAAGGKRNNLPGIIHLAPFYHSHKLMYGRMIIHPYINFNEVEVKEKKKVKVEKKKTMH